MTILTLPPQIQANKPQNPPSNQAYLRLLIQYTKQQEEEKYLPVQKLQLLEEIDQQQKNLNLQIPRNGIKRTETLTPHRDVKNPNPNHTVHKRRNDDNHEGNRSNYTIRITKTKREVGFKGLKDEIEGKNRKDQN